MASKPAKSGHAWHGHFEPKRVPEGIFMRCDGCNATLIRKQVEQNVNVCPECNHHFSVSAVERIAQRAAALGVTFMGETELRSVDMPNRAVRGIHTSTGDFACDELVLCGGIWGPLLGELTGTPIPLHPCAHPYVRTTPLAELEHLRGQQIVVHFDPVGFSWVEIEHQGRNLGRVRPCDKRGNSQLGSSHDDYEEAF